MGLRDLDLEPRCIVCAGKMDLRESALDLSALPRDLFRVGGSDGVPERVHIHPVCLAAIVRAVLQTGSYNPTSSVTRQAVGSLCWLCGEEAANGCYMRVGQRDRDVRVCESCQKHMAGQAYEWAGIPADWREQPRRCETCRHERAGICAADPPVVTERGSRQPEIQGAIRGCDSRWSPKVSGGSRGLD